MQFSEDQIVYVDLPDVSETFVDSFRMVTFDGHAARIELCVTRVDLPKPPLNTPTVRRYPACRLVMSGEAFLALYNQMHQLTTVLEQQGIIKRTQEGEKEPVN